MKLYQMVDDKRIELATRTRYKAVIAKLEGEYLFGDEREKLFDELAFLNDRAARQLGARR